MIDGAFADFDSVQSDKRKSQIINPKSYMLWHTKKVKVK